VSAGAPKQVNIQGPTRKGIKEEIENGNVTLNTFDKAEHEILALLSTDTFARFKQSQLFQQFLDAASTYTHVRKSIDDDKKSEKGRKADLKPKTTFRGTSIDITTEPKKKEVKIGILNSDNSIGIDALMKTLGTDDLFAIHVGGQRVQGSEKGTAIGSVPYQPTIVLETEAEVELDRNGPHTGPPTPTSISLPAVSTTLSSSTKEV